MIGRTPSLSLALVTSLALVGSPGCSTWIDAKDRGRLRPFGGVRAIGKALDRFAPFLPFLAVDFPFSLAADVLTLPIAIFSEVRAARVAHRAQEDAARRRRAARSRPPRPRPAREVAPVAAPVIPAAPTPGPDEPAAAGAVVAGPQDPSVETVVAEPAPGVPRRFVLRVNVQSAGEGPLPPLTLQLWGPEGPIEGVVIPLEGLPRGGQIDRWIELPFDARYDGWPPVPLPEHAPAESEPAGPPLRIDAGTSPGPR